MDLDVDLVTLQGDRKSIKLNSNAQLSSLKKIAAEWKETEEQNIWILYKGRLVDEDETAATCQITNGDKLRIMIKNESKLDKARSLPEAKQGSVPVSNSKMNQWPGAGKALVPGSGTEPVARTDVRSTTSPPSQVGPKPILLPEVGKAGSMSAVPVRPVGVAQLGSGGAAPRGLQPAGLSPVPRTENRDGNAPGGVASLRNRDPPNPVLQSKPAAQPSVASVNTLLDMGFTQTQAEQALQAANSDLQMAIGILTGDAGDPRSQADDQMRMVQEQIKKNPGMLPQYEAMMKQNPQAVELEAQQPGIIRKILTGEVSLGGPQRQTAPTQLTPKDLENISTIREMGFSEEQARDAYTAAGRNLDLAVNNLMDQHAQG